MSPNSLGKWIPIVSAIVIIPIWVYGTFVTQASFRDGNLALIKYIDERHDEAIRRALEGHNDAVSHSDLNRAAMQAVWERTNATLEEIKDLVRAMVQKSFIDGGRNHSSRQ